MELSRLRTKTGDGIGRQERRISAIQTIPHHAVAPPIGLRTLIQNGEKPDDAKDGDRGLQSSGENIVVLRPPRHLIPPDVTLEEQRIGETGVEVRKVVGSPVETTIEEGGHVNELPERARIATSQVPERNGDDGADKETINRSIVETTMREETLRTDGTPDHSGREEGLITGASEPIDLIGLAKVRDIGELPVDDSETGEEGEDRGGELGDEDVTRRGACSSERA